ERTPMTMRATRTQTDIEALRTDLRAMLDQVDRLLADHARPVPTTDVSARPAAALADLPALISVEKAAEILGLSRAAAYRLAPTAWAARGNSGPVVSADGSTSSPPVFTSCSNPTRWPHRRGAHHERKRFQEGRPVGLPFRPGTRPADR